MLERVQREDYYTASASMGAWMRDPGPGRYVSELSASTSIWRERFAQCARDARVKERKRIWMSLCGNPRKKVEE